MWRAWRPCAVEGTGWLDGGDTPAQRGLDAAAAAVVGASVFAMEAIMAGQARRAFVPIAGPAPRRPRPCRGFLRLQRLRRGDRSCCAPGMACSRVAYVDIDAHHGDGVFYAFEDDPALIFADIHEDGRYLYPGTGAADETGRGAAAGTKLNIPLAPGAGDEEFRGGLGACRGAPRRDFRPEFIVFQCGADSLAGDPITHLQLLAGRPRLCRRASVRAGRPLVRRAAAGARVAAATTGAISPTAWTAVVEAFVAAGRPPEQVSAPIGRRTGGLG